MIVARTVVIMFVALVRASGTSLALRDPSFRDCLLARRSWQSSGSWRRRCFSLDVDIFIDRPVAIVDTMMSVSTIFDA